MHGLDLERTKKLYEPYLAGVGNRDDLNYLFAEMLGEITASHLAVAGGAHAFEPQRVPGGFLAPISKGRRGLDGAVAPEPGEEVPAASVSELPSTVNAGSGAGWHPARGLLTRAVCAD